MGGVTPQEVGPRCHLSGGVILVRHNGISEPGLILVRHNGISEPGLILLRHDGISEPGLIESDVIWADGLASDGTGSRQIWPLISS